MKASEICIGDWFKAIDYNSPFRITAIYDDVVQTQADYQSEIDGNWYSEAYIKDLVPIELTEEILVKNGFEKKIYTSPSNNEDYRYYQWNPTPEYPDEGVWLWPDGDSYTYNSRISDIKINSVHQLQHLLRLCGIEKEIEL